MKVAGLVVALLSPLGCFAEDFFPPGSFSSESAVDARRASSLSSDLTALEERSLYSKHIAKDMECYRFTWLRSFDKPVVLRLDVPKTGTATFTVKVGDSYGTTATGRFSRNEVRAVSEQTVNVLRAAFERAKFFDLKPDHDREREIMDGSLWLVEAVVNGRFYVSSRESPEPGQPIHIVGMQFIEFAIGGDFTPIY